MSGNCVTKALNGAWESAKIYAGAIVNEFTENGYYGEKFKGTQSVGDALSRAGSVYKDSGEIVAAGATKLTKMSLGYKLYEYAKENPEQVKKAANYTLLGVVANYAKENPEKVKEATKYTLLGIIPLIADKIKN